MNGPPRVLLAWALLAICPFAVWAADDAPQEDETATISGTVVDNEDRPIAGATISLFKDITETPRHWERVREGVETDESGRFSFEDVPNSDTFYLLMVKKEGMAPAFRNVMLKGGEDAEAKVFMAPAVTGLLQVRDADGKPLAGATFRALGINSANGKFWLYPPRSWKTFGYKFPKSNAEGRLRFPPLPQGATFEAVIQHPNWAPAHIQNDVANIHEPINVTLKPGVELTIRLSAAEGLTLPDHVLLTILHDPFDHPSTIVGYPVPVDNQGKVRLTIAPGRYLVLRLTHGDYVLAPAAYARVRNKTSLDFPGMGAVAPFEFRVLPRRIVRGKVINSMTGQPIVGAFVRGETSIHNVREALPAERQQFVHEWNSADIAKTDENGVYKLELPPGLARLSLSHKGYTTSKRFYKIEISATEATAGPEIRVYPLPEITGIVQDESGDAVPGVVIKMRGDLRSMTPDRTDEHGRFKITPTRIPINSETEKRASVQPLVAFHPYKRLMSKIEVDLSDPNSLKDIKLTLKPGEPGALLNNFREEMSKRERGELSPERLAEITAGSLQGEPAPPLEGTWFNVPEEIDGLEDFRGRYVLLDFWFIGCGPCRAEVPTLKMLYELYHDHDVAIIAVHNNSQSAEVVKEYINEHDYPYSVLVDRPDGRTIERYKGHGLNGYPSYLLIGPDGQIINDDRTTPGPSMRIYKIEIVRELLLGDTRAVEAP